MNKLSRESQQSSFLDVSLQSSFLVMPHRIVNQLRALLTDALYGLGSSGAPSQQSSLTSAAAGPAPALAEQHNTTAQQHSTALSAAAEELAAAPLFAGKTRPATEKRTEKHAGSEVETVQVGTMQVGTIKETFTEVVDTQVTTKPKSLDLQKVPPAPVVDRVWGQPATGSKPTFAHTSAPHTSAPHTSAPYTATGHPSISAWSRTSPFSGSMSSLPMHGLPTPVVLRHASLPQDTVLEPGM